MDTKKKQTPKATTKRAVARRSVKGGRELVGRATPKLSANHCETLLRLND